MFDLATLKKYADVLIKFGLNGGEGVKSGEVVVLRVNNQVNPMLEPLQLSVLEAGAIPYFYYTPDGLTPSLIQNGNEKQISFIPEAVYEGLVKIADHFVTIKAKGDLHELDGFDSKKVSLSQTPGKFLLKLRRDKEKQGKLTWTLGSFPTEGVAKEAGMSMEEYWNEMVKACYLDEDDPVAKWREIFKQVSSIKEKLDNMNINKLHVVGDDVDLWVGVKDRRWLGGSGRNIPSYEVFVSPDWREVKGRIKLNQHIYIYGSMIKDIELTFENGVVTGFDASEGKDMLEEILQTENMDKIGEFSLTDRRLSQITKFMADTLYDENVGGEFGNTHIALGNAYLDSYKGDVTLLTENEIKGLGFNQSSDHIDIISTTDRTVTAYLENGDEVLIYQDGEFMI